MSLPRSKSFLQTPSFPYSIYNLSKVSQFTPTCLRAPLAVRCCYEAVALKQKLASDTGSIQLTVCSIQLTVYSILMVLYNPE